MMSSVISTMNRSTITSDALVSLYDLVRYSMQSRARSIVMRQFARHGHYHRR
jgi:hypothetical protein